MQFLIPYLHFQQHLIFSSHLQTSHWPCILATAAYLFFHIFCSRWIKEYCTFRKKPYSVLLYKLYSVSSVKWEGLHKNSAGIATCLTASQYIVEFSSSLYSDTTIVLSSMFVQGYPGCLLGSCLERKGLCKHSVGNCNILAAAHRPQ